MTDEIVKVDNAELTFDGKRVRSTDEEIMMAIAPIFSFYQNAKPTEEMLNVYKMLLRDIAPDALAHAVLNAMKVCKFAPTIADIREQLETRAPGPRSDVDPKTLPNFRGESAKCPSSDEDKEERMERLRATRNWDRLYQ